MALERARADGRAAPRGCEVVFATAAGDKRGRRRLLEVQESELSGRDA
jgi:hypothetical protein